jgi:hypothetical protein
MWDWCTVATNRAGEMEMICGGAVCCAYEKKLRKANGTVRCYWPNVRVPGVVNADISAFKNNYIGANECFRSAANHA